MEKYRKNMLGYLKKTWPEYAQRNGIEVKCSVCGHTSNPKNSKEENKNVESK